MEGSFSWEEFVSFIQWLVHDTMQKDKVNWNKDQDTDLIVVSFILSSEELISLKSKEKWASNIDCM